MNQLKRGDLVLIYRDNVAWVDGGLGYLDTRDPEDDSWRIIDILDHTKLKWAKNHQILKLDVKKEKMLAQMKDIVEEPKLQEVIIQQSQVIREQDILLDKYKKFWYKISRLFLDLFKKD